MADTPTDREQAEREAREKAEKIAEIAWHVPGPGTDALVQAILPELLPVYRRREEAERASEADRRALEISRRFREKAEARLGQETAAKWDMYERASKAERERDSIDEALAIEVKARGEAEAALSETREELMQSYHQQALDMEALVRTVANVHADTLNYTRKAEAALAEARRDAAYQTERATKYNAECNAARKSEQDARALLLNVESIFSAELRGTPFLAARIRAYLHPASETPAHDEKCARMRDAAVCGYTFGLRHPNVCPCACHAPASETPAPAAWDVRAQMEALPAPATPTSEPENPYDDPKVPLPVSLPETSEHRCPSLEGPHEPDIYCSPDDKESIVVAAIRVGYVVYTGPHHHQIIRYVSELTGKPVHGEQGFVTSRGRFVSRVEGGRIARDAGQLGKEKTGGVTILFSESLWVVTDYQLAGLPNSAPLRLTGLCKKHPKAMIELDGDLCPVCAMEKLGGKS